MGSEHQRAKAREAEAFVAALTASKRNLADYIKHDYSLREWSRSIEEMYVNQWLNHDRHPDAGWDWIEVDRRYRGLKEKKIALLSKGRLVALALVMVSKTRVLVRLLEGDPRPDCHMKGVRASVLLDFSATYGQCLGRGEIHLQPVNGQLAELYRSSFGFVDGKDSANEPILKRKLK